MSVFLLITVFLTFNVYHSVTSINMAAFTNCTTLGDHVLSKLIVMETTVQNFAHMFSQIQTDLSQEKKKSANLQATVSLLRSSLAQESAKTTGLQTTLSLLQSTLIQESAKITGLQSTLLMLQTSLAQESAKRTGLQSTVSLLQSTLAQESAKSSGLQSTVSQLQAVLTNTNQETTETVVAQKSRDYGSTYIRWGRKQCTIVGTETVYSGFTAAQEYTKSGTSAGGPPNILCLPNNPELSNRTTPGSSFIAGSEYQDANFFKSGAEDQDVPCALCRSQNTSTSVMIPGRITCYPGWKVEYYGILASGNTGHRPSSYICIDSNPDFLQGGQGNMNGFVIYATTTKCGSLPCPPYSDNKAINCVVCSK